MGKMVVVTVALALVTSDVAAKPRDLLATSQPPLQKRTVEVRRDGARLLLDVQLSDLLTAVQKERLTRGYTTRVEGRVELRREAGGKPVASARIERRVTFDLWTKTFLVVVRDPGQQRTLKFPRSEIGKAVAALTDLKRVAVAPLATIARGKRYFLRISVTLNPVSEWLRLEMGQWLKRECSDNIPRRMSGGRATFVSRRVCETAGRGAEKVLALRSQTFTLRDVKRRR